ncbi:MliC family protein [Ideonella sp. B508-1]|uniref:MliC family protein n=1 Tax=Ideonella sp. B508-1 TaxID=137716 RepID=UPI0011D24C14|nr:MliC family protein [Ideonella sp. B508-1]
MPSLTPALGLGLFLATAAAAWAGPTDYRCPGAHTLRAAFTPRDAIVTFDGQTYTLRRVRDAREARFTDSRLGLSLALSGSNASWQRKGEDDLVCRKVIASLEPEALEGRRAAPSAPAR